jgi:uncharacterized protein
MCELDVWEPRFEDHLRRVMATDPAHDLSHIRRVVANAKRIATAEQAQMEVVVPAAWLHDVVKFGKSDPRNKKSARLAAAEAIRFLREAGYPEQYIGAIAHAIEAHSFSGNVEPQTLEAKCVQDADRMDALGAIGIARTFATTGTMGRPLYCEEDPWAQRRELNDKEYALDHFEQKLFRVAETLNTQAGRAEGRKRAEFLRGYIEQLRTELGQ